MKVPLQWFDSTFPFFEHNIAIDIVPVWMKLSPKKKGAKQILRPVNTSIYQPAISQSRVG